MPTDVVKKIGATNTPTTMDYSTLAAWIAACPANLVTADQRWIGEVYDQGELTGSGNLLAISGITTDATRYIILRCATGASFNAKAGVRTTALDYNASNGVAIRSTGTYVDTVTCSVDYTQFTGLQIKNDSTNNGDRRALAVSSGVNTLIDSCILKSGSKTTAAAAGLIKNTLIINGRSNGTGLGPASASMSAQGCTVVSTASSSAAALGSGFNGWTYSNNAVFGFTSVTAATGLSGDYNATDLGSIQGAHSQTSVNFAAAFVNNASDFRAASAGGLHHGTPDPTVLPVDISNTARSATTPWIGCWEVVASGRVSRPAPMSGLGGAGQQAFNPSLAGM